MVTLNTAAPEVPPLSLVLANDPPFLHAKAADDGPFIHLGANTGRMLHLESGSDNADPTATELQKIVRAPPRKRFHRSRLNGQQPVTTGSSAMPFETPRTVQTPRIPAASSVRPEVPPSHSPGSVLKKTYNPLMGSDHYFGRDVDESVETASPRGAYRKFQEPSAYTRRRMKKEEEAARPDDNQAVETKYWKKMVPGVRKGDVIIRSAKSHLRAHESSPRSKSPSDEPLVSSRRQSAHAKSDTATPPTDVVPGTAAAASTQ